MDREKCLNKIFEIARKNNWSKNHLNKICFSFVTTNTKLIKLFTEDLEDNEKFMSEVVDKK